MYLSERQRIEMALPVHLLLAVVLAGAEVREPPEPGPLKALARIGRRHFRQLTERQTYPYRVQAYHSYVLCRRLLEDVNLSITEDLVTAQRLKILRRVERLHQKLIDPHLKSSPKMGKIGLIAFHFLQILVSERWIMVAEDSDLQRALDLLLPGLEHVARQEKVDQSAQKQARRVFEQMQREGYYRG
jgi:hypothetical protein